MSSASDLVLEFAPWSISKADLAKKCPKAFSMRYIKRIASASGTEARVGTAAHRVLELALQGRPLLEAEETAIAEARDLTTAELEDLASLRENIIAYLGRIETFREKHGVIEELHEARWGITLAGAAIGYDDPKAFFRGSVDHLLVQNTRRAVIVDHKSGKLKSAADYAKQLDAYAVLTVANRENVAGTYTGVHFLRAAHLDWNTVHPRDRVQRTLLPWLRDYIRSCAAGLGAYEARPTRLCPWCDYLPQCEEGSAFVSVNKLKRKKSPAPKKASTNTPDSAV